MIDRKKFFDGVRAHLFHGTLSQGQVDGMNAILDEWNRRVLTDLRWLAYMLATTKWETAHTMQPIEEYGKGHGHSYGVPVNGHVYYGRGYVQLTWLANYQKMAAITGADLVNHPELALDKTVAAQIMFEGMIRGSFTGKKLVDYFGPGLQNWAGARMIINGMDHANDIAGIARQFYADIQASDSLTYPQS